jgi:heavy metal efflux system protein
MNGIPHLTASALVSLFGLSSLMLIFDDESENDWNRAKRSGTARK